MAFRYSSWQVFPYLDGQKQTLLDQFKMMLDFSKDRTSHKLLHARSATPSTALNPSSSTSVKLRAGKQCRVRPCVTRCVRGHAFVP